MFGISVEVTKRKEEKAFLMFSSYRFILLSPLAQEKRQQQIGNDERMSYFITCEDGWERINKLFRKSVDYREKTKEDLGQLTLKKVQHLKELMQTLN